MPKLTPHRVVVQVPFEIDTRDQQFPRTQPGLERQTVHRLLQLDPQYIAIKEATIPGLLGLATLASTWTRWPLVKTFLFNEQVMRVERVHDALRQHGTERQFERRLMVASWMVAGSFFLSSALNYGLAKYLLVSEPGTPAFAEELGKMTALSFPVIALPSTLVLVAALFYLLQGVQKLTHLQLDDIFQEV